jgi:hypothetical protein
MQIHWQFCRLKEYLKDNMMNEQDAIMLSNKQKLTLDGVEENDEAVLAEVTGGGGIADVLGKGYYKTGDTFCFAPSGGSKPLAVKPYSGPLSNIGTVAIPGKNGYYVSYMGEAKNGQPAMSSVTLEKHRAN